MKELNIICGVIIAMLLYSCSNGRSYNDGRFAWVDTTGLEDRISDMAIISSKPTTIEIKSITDSDVILLSDIADSVKIIPLESDINYMVGSVDKILMDDNSIYILDRKKNAGIYRFSPNGKFIKSIGKRGEGPDEFFEPTDFDVIGDSVIILDQFSSKLLYYSKEGLHSVSKKLPFFVTGLSVMNDTTYLFNSNDGG